MTLDAVVGICASLVAPGTGQAIAGRRALAAGWAIVALASTLLVGLSVWIVPAIVGLRLVAAGDAYRCLRRNSPGRAPALAISTALLGIVGLIYAQTTIRVFTIPSASMEPTLRVGDEILVDTLAWHHHAPHRGDVLVFKSPCSDQTLVKRLIARGGDTVEVRCGAVYVNGTLTEPSRGSAAEVHDFPRRDIHVQPSCKQAIAGQVIETRPATTASPCDPQLQLQIPPGALFFLGDNRSNANDSRYLGLVDERSVIGVVVGTIGGSGWRDVR